MDKKDRILVVASILLVLLFVVSHGFVLKTINLPIMKALSIIELKLLKGDKDLTTLNDHVENIYDEMAGMHGKISGMEESLARIETSLIGE